MSSSWRPATAWHRPVVAEIDLEAIRSNVALLRRLVAPALLCVVVKADGYGHGAVPVAAAALRGGVDVLAVAFVDEALILRDAGIEGALLVLVEPGREEIALAVEHDLELCLSSARAIEDAASLARGSRPLRVHLKVDTGMHRQGVDPSHVLALAREIAGAEGLQLAGLFTHFAVADELDDPFTALQVERLERARAELAAAGIEVPVVHAANSAGAIAHPDSRLDLVRVGVAAYGVLPALELAPVLEAQLPAGEALRPALRLVASVNLVRSVAKGERTGYGLHYELLAPGQLATVPIGYADGVPRSLGATGGEVLIRGCRRRIAGTVSMDQLIIDLGADDSVRPGDEVVLIGRQGDEEITAWEWAERGGTVAYEVLARIGPRVARVYRDGDGDLDAARAGGDTISR